MRSNRHIPVLLRQVPGLLLFHCPLLTQVTLIAAQHDVGTFAVRVDLQLTCKHNQIALEREFRGRRPWSLTSELYWVSDFHYSQQLDTAFGAAPFYYNVNKQNYSRWIHYSFCLFWVLNYVCLNNKNPFPSIGLGRNPGRTF